MQNYSFFLIVKQFTTKKLSSSFPFELGNLMLGNHTSKETLKTVDCGLRTEVLKQRCRIPPDILTLNRIATKDYEPFNHIAEFTDVSCPIELL